MKIAETEGTDIQNIAETEGTDIRNIAETEGTDMSNRGFAKKSRLLLCMLFSMILFQNALAAELNIFSVDNETYKGVIKQDNKIEFVEGFIDAKTGYFLVNNSLMTSELKATDDGTGDKATDDGTGDKATDDGTGKVLTISLTCSDDQNIGVMNTSHNTENIIIDSIEINGSNGCID
jgi:hypothetical protein